MGRLFGTHSEDQDPDGLDAHKPGAKLDAGKPRMTLVLQNFGRALTLVGRVGTYGANKYSDNGWAFVHNGVERYSDAMFRHLLEEEYALQPDPESRIPHAAHAAWNALARLELMLRQELEADSEVWEAPCVKKSHEINEQSDGVREIAKEAEEKWNQYVDKCKKRRVERGEPQTGENVTWQEFLDSLDEARENDRPESWVQHLRDNLPINPRLEYLLNHGTKGAAEDAELEELQYEDAVMRGWRGDMPLSEVEETARLWEEMLDNYYAELRQAGIGKPLPAPLCEYLDKMLETGWPPNNASVVRWHIRQEAKRRGWVLKTGHKPEIGVGGAVVSKTRLTEVLNDPDMNKTLAMILRKIKGPEPEPGQVVSAEMQEKAIALAQTLFSGKSSEVAIVAISENPADFDELTDGLRKLAELTKDVPERLLSDREVTKKQRTAKALRSIVDATGVVLDDEHEAMLSKCEASTTEIGDTHEVGKASEVSSLNDFRDRLKFLVDLRALTQLEAGKLFDEAMDIAIERGVFATSQEAALYRAEKVCEEIEAKRRMDAAIADEQRLISREEAIERNEEARRIAEDVAGVDAYDQPGRPRFDDTVMPEFEEVKPKPLDLIEENAKVLQEAAKADLKPLDEAIAEHNAKQIEAINALTAQRVSTTGPSIEIHMRPMSIEETEKLDAELKAKGMRISPKAEAERAERLRLRKLIAPMKPALMERIQLGEGLHESMKGRRFTEEELSDLAELRINEMVSNRMKEAEIAAQKKRNEELIRDTRNKCNMPPLPEQGQDKNVEIDVSDQDHLSWWFDDESRDV